jgi:hypothetical protein
MIDGKERLPLTKHIFKFEVVGEVASKLGDHSPNHTPFICHVSR